MRHLPTRRIDHLADMPTAALESMIDNHATIAFQALAVYVERPDADERLRDVVLARMVDSVPDLHRPDADKRTAYEWLDQVLVPMAKRPLRDESAHLALSRLRRGIIVAAAVCMEARRITDPHG